MELVGQHTDADIAGCFIQIPVIGAHVYNAGDATAVAGWKCTFDEAHLLDGLRLEHGENTQHVLSIVDGNPIQQEQVLIWPAAAHINAGKAFQPALHPRKQLDGFDDIRFSEERRSRFYNLQGHLDGTHLGGGNTGFLLCGDYGFR